MGIFYKKRMERYNEIQVEKNKMDLNNKKNIINPPSPDQWELL